MLLSNIRNLTASKKFGIITILAAHFGLPWNDAVVARCYDAIDVAVRDYVGRMQKYFVTEGSCLFRIDDDTNKE